MNQVGLSRADFNHADLESAAALYLPLIAALLLRMLQGPRPRRFAANLLGTLWVAASLLLLQRLNQLAHWWSFPAATFTLRELPLALYAGWIILWGALPQLALPRLRLRWTIAAAFAFDLLTMPMLGSILHLNSNWLAGEGVAVVIVLMPALCLARWTQNDTHLSFRAALQVILSGLLFLFWLPEIAFALRPGRGWQPLLSLRGWQIQLAMQAILILAIPGFSAVFEFARRGQGTPIPYDPPRRLVTTGIYRYVANPMQLSCGVVMLAWAVLLRNPWLVLAAAISFIYSAGIAEWDEGQDLRRRFGPAWSDYRASVKSWLPRWRPYHAGPTAKLYIASTCGPCSELRIWIESKHPIGLEILPAESIPGIQRIRYQAADATDSEAREAVEGVRGLARALEHLHLGWAFVGAALRLPIVWQVIQILTDASGLGPRRIPYRAQDVEEPL